MSHDFAIRSWRVTTNLLKGKGEDSVEFTVPAARGAYTYSCTPHARDDARDVDRKLAVACAIASARRSPRPTPRPATSAGSSPPSPIATTSSPSALVRQDRRWKRRLVSMAGVSAGHPRARPRLRHRRHRLRARRRAARAVGLDITHRMVELARGEAARAPGPAFLAGDMMALPFPDATLRRRDDRLRHPQRAGPAVALCRDSRGCSSPAAFCCRSTSTARRMPLVRGVYLTLPHGRRLGARAGAAPRSRHLSLHSGVDPPLSRRRRGLRDRARRRVCALRRRAPSSVASWPSIARSNSTPFHTSAAVKTLEFLDDSVTIVGSEIPNAFVGRSLPGSGATDGRRKPETYVQARQLIKADVHPGRHMVGVSVVTRI